MVYIPNPADPTRPLDTDPAASAANEFRTLKAYIQTVLATAGIGGLNMYRKNLVVNGDMLFDQRLEGANVAFASNYGADKWFTTAVAAAGGNARTVANTLGGGALNMLTYTTNALSAPLAADTATIKTGIEGTTTAQLLYGTAGAKACSLSFVCSSPVSGNHCFALRNSANNRSYVGTFNIPVINTPTFVTVNNIPGDVAGAWLTTAGLGISLSFDMGSGTNFEGVAGWQNGNFTRIAGSVSPNTVLNGVFKLSLVQFEQSVAASAFEFLDYTTSLSRCQRYFWKTYNPGIATGTKTVTAGLVNSATQELSLLVSNTAAAFQRPMMFRFPTPMRAAPTVTTNNPVNANTNAYDFTSAIDLGCTVGGSGPTGFGLQLIPAGSTLGDVALINAWANADFF